LKIKKKSMWKHRETSAVVRVSRLRKTEVCFYPKDGGGKESKLEREDFLAEYEGYNDS